MNDAELGKDATGDVLISVSGVSDMVAMHIEITYDSSVLEFQEIKNGDVIPASALVVTNPDEPDRIIISYAALDPITTDGTLFEAGFKALGDEGVTTTVGLENVEAFDSNGFDILIDTQSGQVSITSGGFPWLWVLLGVLILVLIVVLVRFLQLRGRQQPAGRGPQGPPQQGSAPTAQPPTFCISCGESMQPGATFCPSCGSRVGG